MSLEILTDFDGACPHSPDGVKIDDQGAVTLFPSRRSLEGRSEEQPGLGSRFSTRIVNPGNRAERALIRADWETDARTRNHDLGYVRHENEDEWTMVPGIRRGAVIAYDLELAPGVTHLGLYPEYNCEQCARLARRLAERGAEVEVAGPSREQRDMWLIRFESSNPDARSFFLQARDHAYETAGSYCVEGIADFLASSSPLSQYLRSKFSVFILPMTNPDGVYNGMSRLTWEQGADMNRVHTVPDAAHDTLKRAIDRVEPFVHMNVHNWTSKFVDGLLSNEQEIADRIRQHMPDDAAHFKRWRVETLYSFLQAHKVSSVPKANMSWKDYCKDQFGAIGVNFEFPWFALSTNEMKAKGRQAFIAFALAVIEETRL